jgi:UDP-glucose 4-epimerase
VIGGAGFIGSHLVDRLMERRDSVTVFDNLSTGKRSFLAAHEGRPRFRFVRGDILEPSALRRAMRKNDWVFHLAANADIMKAMREPALDYEQGIRATFYVLEAMRMEGARRLVYLSGSGVYGDYGTRRVSEDQGPLRPQSMYGAAKLASEAMISAYSHLYGMRAWIFRPANIIGARPTHGVIFDLRRKLRRDPRALRVLGDGRQSKSYLHVDDLLDAVFLAMKKGKGNVNQYNVAGPTYLTVRAIAGSLIREMGLRKVKVYYGREPRGWKGDIPKYRLDTGRLAALGWKPRYDSRGAVVRTIREILGRADS